VKSDKSPVTIADLAAQAIILAELAKAFPNDAVVAEETSAPLSEDTDASRHVRVVRRRSSIRRLCSCACFVVNDAVYS
jgi:3'-phosphoadenosine 5'-phosphosulfate (PAPS) 3'-phosphatase